MKVKDKVQKDKVDFADLAEGDCFKDDDGDICIKTDWEQDSVDLVTGAVYAGQCGHKVTPVNAEVRIID